MANQGTYVLMPNIRHDARYQTMSAAAFKKMILNYWDNAKVYQDRPSKLEWAALRAEVFERDGYICMYCGSRGPLACDHVVPVSKGGDNASFNLLTACKPCNMAKAAKLLENWFCFLPEHIPPSLSMVRSDG